MKVKRIYISDWSKLKPYDNHSITDNYYLKLSNELKKEMLVLNKDWLEQYLSEEEINLLSCFLASYFEDIISETNVFVSFVNAHQKLYGKKLPFYDTIEYYENEINIEDVRFLLWYFMNTIQDELFLSPYNTAFEEIANNVMVVLEEAYEYAPENELLKTFYSISNDEVDFYKGREMIDAILFRSYLYYTDTYQNFLQNEEMILESSYDNENIISILNESRDTSLFSFNTKLMGYRGNEWVAEIIGEKHPLYKDYSAISPKIRGYFLYKGQDEQNIFIEHIASGRNFNMTKNSFDDGDLLTKVDSILFIGLVLWKKEWWFSGIYFSQAFDADLVLDEKNSIKSRMAVNFLESENNELEKSILSQYEAFLDFNNGKQIAFIPADEVELFTKEFISYYNKSLNLTKQQTKEAKERLNKESFFGGNDTVKTDFSKDFETALVFFNPKSGLEIAFEVNSAFPFKENNYFDKTKSTEHLLRLFLSKELSKELTIFCVDNFKEVLPLFKTSEGQFLLNDLDFMLRFFKGRHYHSTPQVTVIGER